MSHSFVFITTFMKLKFSPIKCYFILGQIKWLSGCHFTQMNSFNLFFRLQMMLFACKCCVSEEEHWGAIYHDFSAFYLREYYDIFYVRRLYSIYKEKYL